jgi:polyphosphate kinase 2 (PPK2 family)
VTIFNRSHYEDVLVARVHKLVPERSRLQRTKLWGHYTKAYEEVLSRCSTKHAPWFVIPSDHKWFRNLAIARIVVEYLESLGMKLPKPSVNLARIRRQYHAARGA